MPERAAPLVLVVDPAAAGSQPPFGSYAATARAGQVLLAAELSRRLGALGVAVAPLPPVRADAGRRFHWGRWYVAAARARLDSSAAAVDAIGYAGAGALALLPDAALDALVSPLRGEIVANNRFSADAFVVAGDLQSALAALEACETDNGAARALTDAGFAVRDLSTERWSRFDVDTPQDLALLRLANRLPETRRLDAAAAGFLEMATLPGGRRLEVPGLGALGEVIRGREAQLVVAGRVPGASVAYLETETACRVRWFIEERGMRSAPGHPPRSLLGDWAARQGASDLVRELAALGDAVILDSRVLMASLAASSHADDWPGEEERFASDFLDTGPVHTPWLAELTAAARGASVPVVMGGHALVSDGLRILVDAAWLGR